MVVDKVGKIARYGFVRPPYLQRQNLRTAEYIAMLIRSTDSKTEVTLRIRTLQFQRDRMHLALVQQHIAVERIHAVFHLLCRRKTDIDILNILQPVESRIGIIYVPAVETCTRRKETVLDQRLFPDIAVRTVNNMESLIHLHTVGLLFVFFETQRIVPHHQINITHIIRRVRSVRNRIVRRRRIETQGQVYLFRPFHRISLIRDILFIKGIITLAA